MIQISERQQAYQNNLGTARIAEERRLNDQGRKVISEKRGGEVKKRGCSKMSTVISYHQIRRETFQKEAKIQTAKIEQQTLFETDILEMIFKLDNFQELICEMSK